MLLAYVIAVGAQFFRPGLRDFCNNLTTSPELAADSGAWRNANPGPHYTDPNELLAPVKAIRAKCLDCTGEQPKEVRMCPSYYCPIWPYRMGARPTSKLYDEKPPRYVTPAHLPVMDNAGRIVSPAERKSRASSGKTPVDATSGESA